MSSEKPQISFKVWLLKYVVPPVAILLLAAGAVVLANALKPEAPKKDPVVVLPNVEVVVAKSKPITLEVASQGTVQARTETTLVAEVSGRIESISPALFSGGFFEKGDVLVTIDPIDYIANLANAQSRVAEARLALEQEEAAAAQARQDWEELGRGEATPLVLREPQLEKARANLEAARSALKIAQRDLERTTVKAPYSGRAREKLVDVGQIVNARTSILARIYSVDIAEIRLPVSLAETQFIDMPEAYRNGDAAIDKPTVKIEVDYGNQAYIWDGVIDRSEGAIDSRTRLAYVVAQVKEPYSKKDGRPPLKVGLFAKAKIQGRTLADAFEIPRRAVREQNLVYIIDKENRVRIRETHILTADTETAIITKGLKEGDRICLTPLEYAVDGMQVDIVGSDEQKTGDWGQVVADTTRTSEDEVEATIK